MTATLSETNGTWSSKVFTSIERNVNPTPMTTSPQQVRRATIEDLPQLIALWKQEDLPWEQLEKRLKEFQVVGNEGADVLGLLGLEIAGLEGRIHSEAFARPELADSVRDLLWERAQVVAKNHGLVRIWSQFSTPFWNRCGFHVATDDVLSKLPQAFAGDPTPWRFLQLRDDAALPASVEKEFALFKEMEKAETQKIVQRAKVLKLIAGVVVVAVFVLMLIWVFLWFKTQKAPAQ
jgi:N-acetylglutamate synthase-like GNAT family acetyltransferase